MIFKLRARGAMQIGMKMIKKLRAKINKINYGFMLIYEGTWHLKISGLTADVSQLIV